MKGKSLTAIVFNIITTTILLSMLINGINDMMNGDYVAGLMYALISGAILIDRFRAFFNQKNHPEVEENVYTYETLNEEKTSEERLLEIENLYRKGLITMDELAEKRKKILDEI